jgi:Secretion system C-terminal sorting domain
MKTIISFLLIFSFAANARAQIITHFTWETSPVSAVAGVNAISVSSYATITTGGTNGTNGLNPGAGSHDINLTFDSTAFNVPAIDIAVDFRREESQASFFYRNNFNFGMNGGSISVSFEVVNGASYTTINSGSVYSVPDDHTFHNYHFGYDNNTGIAKIWVDTVVVYTFNGTAGAALYNRGAGNVIVGQLMDATGRNVAVLDNLIIQQYANALLPLDLISFTAEAKNKYAAISWNTTQEVNVSSFIVERSSNGNAFSAIKTVAAFSGYNNINTYQFIDSFPFSPVSYYRLKMMNTDGSFSYSAVKSVTIENTTSEMSAYPNPAINYTTIKMNNTSAAKYHYTVSSITGQVINSSDVQVGSGTQQIQIDLSKTTIKGMLVIHLSNTQNDTAETFTIIKK